MNDETRDRDKLKDLARVRRTARGLSLAGADLRDLVLERSRADGCDFANSDLRGSSLVGVRWKGCILRDARLERANLKDAVLRLCDLDQAHANEASFAGARVENGSARGAVLDEVDFTNAVLTDTDLSRASLRNACLEGVAASGANFRGADLRGANLQGANLVDADLRGADLTEANLTETDLHGADLRGAIGDAVTSPREDDSWRGMPDPLKELAGTMVPVVQEMLRTGGDRGLDPTTVERLIAQVHELKTSAARNPPAPATLRAVSKLMDELGHEDLTTLVEALQLPDGSAPPAAVQSMLRSLQKELGLDEASSADDILLQLAGDDDSLPN